MGYYHNKSEASQLTKIVLCLWSLVFGLLSVTGCQTTQGNNGQINSYTAPVAEADWIRNGEPIKFEDELWYPVDGIESFLDSEVLYMGEYRGVPFFIDKVDVRPYNRLYTKFGRYKFRIFEKRTKNQ